MLGVACPRCGAPTPIALGSDFLECARCQTRSPVTAEAAGELAAARSVLAGLDRRSMQLTGAQRTALSWASRLRGCALVVLLVFALPLGVVAVATLVAMGEHSPTLGMMAWMAALGLGPLALFLTASLLYVRFIGERVRRLEDTCSAVPPERPGELARCHVCGAPLAAAGASAVARCGYCAADNIVEQSALARAAGKRELDLGRYQDLVRAQASATRGVTLTGVFLLPVFALAAPLLTLIGWGAVFALALQWEGPVQRDHRLTWIDIPEGRCLFGYDASAPPGKRLQKPSDIESDAPEPAAPVTFDARELVGKHVRSTGNWIDERTYEGRVVGAYSSPLIPKVAYLKLLLASGKTESIEALGGVCEVTPAPAPAAAPAP